MKLSWVTLNWAEQVWKFVHTLWLILSIFQSYWASCISNKIMLCYNNFLHWELQQMIANDDDCARSLSQTELHDSTLLEFSTAMKCFTDDSNDEFVIFLNSTELMPDRNWPCSVIVPASCINVTVMACQSVTVLRSYCVCFLYCYNIIYKAVFMALKFTHAACWLAPKCVAFVQ